MGPKLPGAMSILRHACLAILVLASLPSLAQQKGDRFRSVSQQMKCDCGCGDVLAECEHVDCKRRPALKKEISDSILRGDSDDQILADMAAAHGSAILVTPMLQGFNRMLWIVPVAIAVLVLGLTAFRVHKTEQASMDK